MPLTEENLIQLSSQLYLKNKKHKVHMKAHHRRSNPHHSHKPNDHTDKLIELINTSDFGWKADPCKLQKHHELYQKHCERDQSLNLAQVKSETDEGKQFGKGDDFEKVLGKAQMFQKQYSDYKSIPDDQLPKHFDWRSIDGYDFTGEIRDQKACGSCYTVAFTQAAEARMKIKYGEEAPQLSPQFLLSCNYLTEGCEGGWPHFHAYFAQNGHLVSEECAPYQASTKGVSCAQYQGCKPEARVQRSYDVGGGYGQSTEKLMMKEILRNGPLNTEFQAPSIFSTYKSGLITQDGFRALQELTEEKAEG